MKLKCYSNKGRCPSYKIGDVFHPNNGTINSLSPDLKKCANCMAYAPPKMPDFADDLQQIATITLVEKGPKYNPKHESHASFGTFIRPRICASLMNAKIKEMNHMSRFQNYMDNDTDKHTDFIADLIDPHGDSFVEDVIWDETIANFEKALPEILPMFSDRERQVFLLIREDKRNKDIAEILNLTPARISVLVRQVESRLKQACIDLMLIE
ncbi:MAG: sigma-70 family RNA polymerase sigma factor [Candidatus Poribacteria bacterium]|nr:sigma-70 family RNA polymerase sigma factor [Candidatus Poribacteria bacterium]